MVLKIVIFKNKIYLMLYIKIKANDHNKFNCLFK